MMFLNSVLARALIVSVATASLAGCVSNADFEDQPFNRSFVDARSYQEVYATTLASMRRCGAVTGPADLLGTSISNYDSQLYSDLGYGEINSYLSGVVTVTYSSMRIEREGSGSRISIRAANMVPSAVERTLDQMQGWALGSQSC